MTPRSCPPRIWPRSPACDRPVGVLGAMTQAPWTCEVGRMGVKQAIVETGRLSLVPLLPRHADDVMALFADRR